MVKTVEQLLTSNSRAVTGSAIGEADVVAQLTALDDWRLDSGSLTKAYRFKNYHETIAFVNALAFMVHREDHHPELRIGYDRCEVRFNTHSVKGISENDFICAAKTDAIYSHRYTRG